MSGTPAAESEINDALVRALLHDQHPDLADLPITLIDSGWDNTMFRLGEAYMIRMPRRALAVDLLANEQSWLPMLAEKLPLPIPAPVRVGQPGHGYPWIWSILPWLPGEPANEQPPRSDQAGIFSGFLRALHQPAPDDAPVNLVRGCPLAERAEGVALRIAQLRASGPGIAPEIDRAWHDGLNAAPARHTVWLHGDLHARNVLVLDGAISAIIDWGDITSGDAATDLAGIWALFEDAGARRAALDSYGAGAADIARARAWAVNFGTILLATGLVDTPRHAAMGMDTLRRVRDDVIADG